MPQRQEMPALNPGIPDPRSLTYVIHNRVMIIEREGVRVLLDIFFCLPLERNVIERAIMSSRALDIGYCICLLEASFLSGRSQLVPRDDSEGRERRESEQQSD